MYDYHITIEFEGRTYGNFNTAMKAMGDSAGRHAREGMRNIAAELLQMLDDVYNELAQKHGNPWPTGGGLFGTAPDRLAMRTGEGLRSIKDSIRVHFGGDNVTGQISPAKLTIHETGGTISAKRSKYLTIPLSAAMDSRGRSLRSKARDWDSTFIARGPSGALFIFRRETGGSVVPLYMLKRTVSIPKRLGMKETLTQHLSYFEAKAMKAFDRAMTNG